MRRYDERVDVRVQQAGPVAFVWRERLYVVRLVLGCWRERQAWWSHRDRGALRAEDIGESRIWRVEARSGRTAGSAGVFDLCESMPLGVIPVGTAPVGTAPISTAPISTAPISTAPISTVESRQQHWRLLRCLD